MGVDWTELPPELLEAISKKLKLLSDYLLFQSVCRRWRSSIPKTPNHLPPQLPWLMLPPSRPHQSRRAFFNLSANRLHLLNLPEASSTCKRLCGSSHGWLIILDESPTILLLNPLTRVKIHLPPLSSFPDVVNFSYFDVGREYTLAAVWMGDRHNLCLRQMRDSFIKKIVLSSCPGDEFDFFAVAILNRPCDLAYCGKGDRCWSLIEGTQSFSEDVVFSKGSFYAVDNGGIAVCDVLGHTSNNKPRVSIIPTPQQFGGDLQYLVGVEDELLLVTRYLGLEFELEPHQPNLVYRTTRFEVFKLNRSEPKWERVTSLGDKALFVGQNSSYALSASDFPGCVGDCIYYTDDYSEGNFDDVYGRHDLGIFKLEDGSIEPLSFYQHSSNCRLRWPLPLWITPSLL